ncbi:hypothetical protein CYY_008320 [Polysphondylium violaceum]|uniref:Methyltransferase type 11 domain-containing protein n=1 Tax=Polysphondylium violaceum TaxID=133409 RepID=A0A8J4V426_9MYCE|nr:hypothetical protein CYY_008320 [Polysphondylium violaceum]
MTQIITPDTVVEKETMFSSIIDNYKKTEEDSHILWKKVDQTKPTDFIQYVDKLTKSETIIELTQKSFERFSVAKGDKIIDLGCGAGKDLMALGAMTGETGEVVGVDLSQEMVNVASARVASQTHIRVIQGSADATPFPDNYFDRARCERLLQHVPKPSDFINEMTRVTKSGGKIAVTDPDWESSRVSGPESAEFAAITKAIFFDCKFNAHPSIGVNLKHYFKQNPSLSNIAIIPAMFTLNSLADANDILCLFSRADLACKQSLITADQLSTFKSEMIQRDQDGTFLFTLTIFTCIADVCKQ